METLVEHLAAFGSDAAAITTRLLAAAAFLLIGGIVAWVIDRLILKFSKRFNLDDSSAGQRLVHIAALAGLKATPSVTIRRLVTWTVILVAVTQAALILELEAVAAVIDRAIWIAPTLVIVLALLYVGAMLAERLARAAQAAAERDDTLPRAYK